MPEPTVLTIFTGFGVPPIIVEVCEMPSDIESISGVKAMCDENAEAVMTLVKNLPYLSFKKFKEIFNEYTRTFDKELEEAIHREAQDELYNG